MTVRLTAFWSRRSRITLLRQMRYPIQMIDQSFGNLIKAGIIGYQVINRDEKGNKHYDDDYELYTKSVILSLIKKAKGLN